MQFIDQVFNGCTDDLKPSDFDLLRPVFVDGKTTNEESLQTIRERIYAEHGGF